MKAVTKAPPFRTSTAAGLTVACGAALFALYLTVSGLWFSLAEVVFVLLTFGYYGLFAIRENERIERNWRHQLMDTVVPFSAAFAVLMVLFERLEAGALGVAFWIEVLAFWLIAWNRTTYLASQTPKNPAAAQIVGLAIPVIFGLTALLLWEFVVRGLDVPSVLLPAPSDVGARFADSIPILWADFVQTFLKAVVAGYVMGCGAGFAVAILIDRSPFLQRGLLPIGNLVSALPIVGVAPIMVMWFGFDWQSKAAVVVVMTFFPMLVNTVAGLSAAGAMERDLMRTYAAGYWASLLKLRLPAAMPFVFNALKINSTLALIGAIVAEFFGTPIVGMGFRISAEIGRLNTDMVWAEIAVAALAGSITYGLISIVERASTFWHPSYRKK